MSECKYFSATFADLHIDMQDLYSLMGYGNNLPSTEISGIIDAMLNELRGCCMPHYGYVCLPVEAMDRDRLSIGGVEIQPGRIITSAVREAEEIAVFVATAGKEFDSWNKMLQQQDDIVHTFIADSLGSVIAEAAVELLVKQIEQDTAVHGLKISNNYSPGYCDWLLVDQKKLFDLLPENFCGIQLTDSCLMLPVKSVSGIIGIGQNVKKRPYGCAICGMTNCVRKMKLEQV